MKNKKRADIIRDRDENASLGNPYEYPGRIKKVFNIFFSFPYVKLGILIIAIIFAYFIFSNSYIDRIVSGLGALSYLGIFISGMLFSFGFTAPFSIGFFLTANPGNIYVAAILGGAGALISDLFILKLIRFSFMDDFNRLKKIKTFSYIGKKIGKTIPSKIKLYTLYFLAGFIIASPLPDEIGVTMLAGLSKIKEATLAAISFTLNTLGILVILLVASL